MQASEDRCKSLQQDVDTLMQDKLQLTAQLLQSNQRNSPPLQLCIHPSAENQSGNLNSSMLDDLKQQMDALHKRQEPYLKAVSLGIEAGGYLA